VSLLAAACGSSSNNSTSHAASTHSKQTLVVWEFWSTAFPGLTKVAKQLNAEFEAQHPNIKIDDVPLSFTQLGPKLTATIAAGTGPNLVTVFPGVAGAAYRDGLIPLQSYITPADRQSWRLLNESVGPGGGIYAIPWTEYGYFIYYNKKLFAKAGLNPNKPPATWPVFMSDLSTLKAHGITGISGGFKDGYEWEWWAFPLLDQLMSPTVTKEFDEYNYPITSPVFSTVWSDVKALGPYFANGAAGLSLYNDAYDNFDGGKAAMLLDAPTLSNLVTAQKDLGTKNVGVFPVPRLTNSLYPPFVDAGPEGGWGITKWSSPAQKADAWQYITWMESKKAAQQMWSESHLIPNNAHASTPTANAAIRTVLTDLANPRNHTIYLGFPVSVLAINERYASDMITGHTSISSVLQMMEQLRLQLKPKIVGEG
jgi:ABC-type glycerol-3-phosphate transport system substrate-binding protein